MRVVGLDLSLLATGVADDAGCRTFGVKVKEHSHWTAYAKRLRKLGQLVDRAIRDADLVVIESPAYNQSSSGHALGELHGIVKVLMLQRAVACAYVAPQQLKKFAANNGNAGKDTVLAAAIRDGSPASNFDEADAWWLRRMGQYAYRPDLAAGLSIYRKHVLEAVSWPEMPVTSAREGAA